MNNKNTQQQTMMQPLMLDFKKVIRTRQLNFDKEFTREYIADVCSALDKLMEFDKIMETPKEALKIKFNIYSYGGQCDSLMYLLSKIDKLKELGYEVETCNKSVAMSCGFILSIYGTVRTCTKHATYLNHQVSSGTGYCTYGEMQNYTEHLQKVQLYFEDIVRQYTHMDEDEVTRPRRTNQDVYYSPCEAVKLGICDMIITDQEVHPHNKIKDFLKKVFDFKLNMVYNDIVVN